VVDVELTEDSVRIEDEKRGISIFAEGKLPDGSMKWVVVVILAIFLGAENVGLLNMP
jgi:hypothetical protein